MVGGKRKLLFVGGLAVVAVILAVFAFNGDDAAAGLCPSAGQPCDNLYPTGTVIEATLERGTEALLSGAATVECKDTAVRFKTLAEEGNPLEGEIVSLSFSGCNTCRAIDAVGLPWKASIEAAPAVAGNGVLTIGEPRMVLRNCTFFNVTCEAGGEELALKLIGGAPAKVFAKAERVGLPGGACGTAGTLTAAFEVVRPDRLYIAG